MTPRAAPGRVALVLSQLEPMSAPCATESVLGSTRYFLLQIYSCPAVLDPKCALQAQEVTSSARDRFYSRRAVRAPRRQKVGLLSKFPARDGVPDSVSHHRCAIRIQCGAREPGKSHEPPGEL